MFKRLYIYYKERYPLLARLLLGMIVFGEIYFIILLNYGVLDFRLGMQEVTGAYTVFAFLLWLRVADDLKDYETDKKLFPDRPLASGRVYKKDTIISCIFFQAIAVALNIIFMNNLVFCAILYAYGFLMRNWFFQRAKIQPNLFLALVTHNPVQMFINLYIISFTVIKYQLNPFSITTLMTLWTLYFPALIWEVSRKIRAPKDETEYTTYSKLWGYKKAIWFVLVLTIVDILTNIVLVWNLSKPTVVFFCGLTTWMTIKFLQFKKDPERFVIVEKVELYTYIQESTMLLTVAGYIFCKWRGII